MLALVVSPVFGDPDEDSYPLSTYPMFARARGKPWLSSAEGIDANEQAVRLSPEVVAHDEVMQVAATVRRAVQAGPLATETLCREIAARLASDPDYQRVQSVRIVAARFDPLRYFSEGPEPEQRTEHARCPVVRAR
jgi:hypothetical protein